MNRKIILLLIFIFTSGYSFSQSFGWITPNQTYLKLSVADDGIYRINKTDFTNAGINTTGIDPRTVKVYNRGLQIPIYFEGESDGTFDNNDFLDFYGTRNYGGLTKYYNENNVLGYTKDEYYNLYSDTNAYWVGWGGSNGTKFSTRNYDAGSPYSLNYFYDKFHSEKDLVYTQGERAEESDFRNFNNELFLGEGWYWELLPHSFSLVDNAVLTPNLVSPAQTAYVKVFAYSKDRTTSIFNEHSLTMQINGTSLTTQYCNDLNRIAVTIPFSSSLLSSFANNSVRAIYNSISPFVGSMYIDMFEIQYPRIFKFLSNQLSANLSNPDTASYLFKISGYSSANPLFIYDVNNGIKITNYSTNADTLTITAKSNSKLEIINKNITKKPFRISQRQVPDLVSTSNGADYLVIYNSMFEDQAQQLVVHRENTDGFRSVKTEMKDIYDIFGYGIENPIAVRNYVKFVFDVWQFPKLKYVCLLGRGSNDPKKNTTASIYYKNLVPTYGNPNSDNYFANFNLNGFTLYPQVAIGRLPAYTVQEAQYMVDNIINYESQVSSPASWWKNFTFITNGSDSAEQAYFNGLMLPLINNYILPSPVYGNANKIFRNDIATYVTFNLKDSVKRAINNGTMIVSYIGHAGYDNWEEALIDPNTLSNYAKLPFAMSMTCYTGKAAECDKRGFGEMFVYMQNRGAIGFLGTPGWGFTYSQTVFQDWILKAISKDTVRRIGDAVKYGAIKMLPDSTISSPRHTINCYFLQGDPAAKLLLPSQPEFSISNSEYRLSNTFPAINEPVTMTIFPKNFGLFADSCKVRFNLKKDNNISAYTDTIIRNFKNSDSVNYTFRLDTLNNYSVDAILDYGNWYPTEVKSNNTLSVSIYLKNILYIPLKPVHNSIVRTGNLQFSGLNPTSDRNNKTVKVILQYDTTNLFNSPLLTTFNTKTISGAVTIFNTALPVLNPGQFYYWRTNAVIDNDSSGWSGVQIFSYNPNLDIADKESNAVPDTNQITLFKSNSAQFPQYDLYNVNYNSTGISLNQTTLNLLAKSHGSNGAEVSYFSVNDKSVYMDGGRNTGLNMIKIKKLTGSIIDYKNFRLSSGTSSDSVLNFLNTFDTTYYLMAVNASYFNCNSLNAATKQKIRDFGSTKIDSFVFGGFDTWSFIGSLYATQSNVTECFHKYSSQAGWVACVVSMDRTIKSTLGTVNNIVGPAQTWQDFSWAQTLYPQSSVKFDVIGIDNNGSQTLLLANQTTNQLVDISSINAYQYPQLNLLTKLAIDSVNGDLSPILNSLTVHYAPASELMLDNNSLSLSDTLIKIGEPVKIYFDYYNAGFIGIPGTIVNIYKTSISTQNLIKSDTINKEMNIDSSRNYYEKFTVPYIRLTNGSKARFYAEILPKGQFNEVHTYNNSASFWLSLKSVVGTSLVEVFSDGHLINSGDYVSSNPELKIQINKKSNTSSLPDISQVQLKLNDELVSDLAGKDDALLTKANSKVNIGGENENSLTINYNPKLNSGENSLKIIYRNESDNMDTVDYVLIVSNELLVKDFYNYPNPMKSETNFIFNLAGESIPGNCKIKIFTVSGRLIKEFDILPSIGFNQIQWDGRDNDGDAVANGTYLYKLIASDDSKTETSTQKLVVLR